MLAYVLRRLLHAVPIVLVGSFITFVMVSASGDPLGDLKAKQPPVPRAVLDAEAHRMRLDQPVLERYWHWLTGIPRGDWGPSVKKIDIGAEIWPRLWVSARLVTLAVLLALALALVVGVVSAVKRYSAVDYAFTAIGFLLLSMPAFWLAILLKQQAIDLNQATGSTLVYTVGEASIPPPTGFWPTVADVLGHLVLPTIVLAMTAFPPWSRFVRSSMIEVQESDYVRLARAKGIKRRKVLVRHALRTALVPLTTVVALDLAVLFSGAVVTETVFQWRGMGSFLLSAVRDKDIYAVMAWLLLVSVIVVVFNLVADLLYAVLDRRVRLG
ncbi:ABC transporter permease [Actinokineospora auranticolor]|uniref:Peptide/nickel transport system permease protein n=1 Tax=Actinokineospora auranticolor TaxID=155976 RepID=A0A2S6GLG2_9PSEU|nr:ABC transporter permease [Actinokineospora auranticolor]PPK66069.1 peptide/nickel transport system permease protein [Actinokineospora auranticolor]